MTLVDTHCHLTHPRYGEDLDDVLARATRAGVARVIAIASTAPDAEVVAALVGGRLAGAEVHAGEDPPPELFGTAGVHPHQAGDAEPGDLERVRALLEAMAWMVAVGETGLDFHYDHSPRALQRELFLAHLELARELDLPVVVHSRAAENDTRDILVDAGAHVRGVLHCFTGPGELMEAALEAGWMISFTGIVTFSGFDAPELVRAVPQDRYMLETDGPYLTPAPYRGKRNEPARVREICEAVARIRGEEPSEVARRTTENAERFFRLPPS